MAFLRDAGRAFPPSMRRHINLPRLFKDALDAVREDRIDGQPPGPLPADCPFDGSELLSQQLDLRALLATVAAAV